MTEHSQRAIERTRVSTNTLDFAEEYPDISLWRCRKIAEIMLLENHREKLVNPTAKSRSLDELIRVGKQLDIISSPNASILKQFSALVILVHIIRAAMKMILVFMKFNPAYKLTESLMSWWDSSFDAADFSVKETIEADDLIEEHKSRERPPQFVNKCERPVKNLG